MLLTPQVKMKACVQSGLSSVEGLQFWSHTVLAGGSIILINHICEINVFCALIVNAYIYALTINAQKTFISHICLSSSIRCQSVKMSIRSRCWIENKCVCSWRRGGGLRFFVPWLPSDRWRSWDCDVCCAILNSERRGRKKMGKKISIEPWIPLCHGLPPPNGKTQMI